MGKALVLSLIVLIIIGWSAWTYYGILALPECSCNKSSSGGSGGGGGGANKWNTGRRRQVDVYLTERSDSESDISCSD